MSKIDVVRAAMVQAMKNKDKERKDALSMLLSVLKNAEIDRRLMIRRRRTGPISGRKRP